MIATSYLNIKHMFPAYNIKHMFPADIPYTKLSASLYQYCSTKHINKIKWDCQPYYVPVEVTNALNFFEIPSLYIHTIIHGRN